MDVADLSLDLKKMYPVHVDTMQSPPKEGQIKRVDHFLVSSFFLVIDFKLEKLFIHTHFSQTQINGTFSLSL